MHNTPEAATVYSPGQSSVTPILPDGYILRDYKIIKMLGRGGFGITYLAQEDITDKLVVIKENYPTEVSFRDMTSLTVGPVAESQKNIYDWALTRFLDEAKTLSGLSHPNIVPIRYAFKALGTAYYVMPHVKGTELHKAAPAPDSITAEWLLPMLEKILHALDYLHSQGIIHRDIKPNNILMREDGEPILIDFGTARALESTHSHTHIGTYGFMPLEQFSSKGKRGPWTDLYALGATFYCLITGEIPPSSMDRMEEDEYLPLTVRPSLAKRFPVHVLSSIDKALMMNRHERWQSAKEWLQALKGNPSSPAAETKPNINLQPNTPPSPAPKSTQTASKIKTRFKLSIVIFLLILVGVRIFPLPPNILLRMDGIKPEQYSSELSQAVSLNDVKQVQRLIAAGANANYTGSNGSTPLIEAINDTDTAILRLLLTSPGIDVNRADIRNLTPLIHAVNQGNTECVRLLLAAPGIDVNKADSYSSTPLSLAAKKGHIECMNLLLNAPGIDVNKNSPLYHATYNGHTECVRLLLAAPGIDVNRRHNGQTPLETAELFRKRNCADLIRAAGGRR